jgi:hypothetical protein
LVPGVKIIHSAAVGTMLYVLGASRAVYIIDFQEMEQAETGVGAFA